MKKGPEIIQRQGQRMLSMARPQRTTIGLSLDDFRARFLHEKHHFPFAARLKAQQTANTRQRPRRFQNRDGEQLNAAFNLAKDLWK